MSDALTTVKEIYAAFGRGDINGILSRLSNDVIWTAEGPKAISFCGVRHGAAEVPGFFEAIARDHSDPKLTIDAYISEGDQVATFGRYSATMKATGKRADTPVAHCWKVRDGKVARYDGFIDAGAFLDALRA
jgi:ketosteroid isomerase-like protein